MRGYKVHFGDISSKGEESIFVEGNLTIATCSDLRVDLLHALEGNSHVSIVAQNLGDVDLSGIQVLLSAIKWRERQGRSVSIRTSFSQETEGLLRSSGLLAKINR